MKKLFFVFFAILVICILTSCKDNNKNTISDHFDLTGTWLVTRTLVTQSPDFPNGYQDQQTWKFQKNGSSYTLITSSGSIVGEWKSSSAFSSPHWVFDISWQDQNTGLYSRVVVEIINNNPLKGTDDTYYMDTNNNIWLLLDSFSLTGVKQ